MLPCPVSKVCRLTVRIADVPELTGEVRVLELLAVLDEDETTRLAKGCGAHAPAPPKILPPLNPLTAPATAMHC